MDGQCTTKQADIQVKLPFGGIKIKSNSNMSGWNPALYAKNATSRLKPALDLLHKTVLSLPAQGNKVNRVLDLGCGPGSVTPYLREAFPQAMIKGVDSSSAMIEAATSNNVPEVHFKTASIESILKEAETAKEKNDASFDVVYSNAALHWIDNHESVFPNILRYLVREGGLLAVQMPDTRVQLSHTLITDACNKCGYKKEITHTRIPRVERDASYYYDIMYGHFTDIEMWSTEYVQQIVHEPKTPHPVLEYVRATGMMPIVDALGGVDSHKTKEVLKLYEKLLFDMYPPRFVLPLGNQTSVLFPFKRFFMIVKK